MRRFLGFLLVAGLLIGGASGCSSDDDKKADTKTDSTEATSDDGGETSSGNADVQAYCDAVDEYVAAVKDAGTDATKVQALTEQAQELSKKAAALGGITNADDAQAVADCTKKSTDALMPG